MEAAGLRSYLWLSPAIARLLDPCSTWALLSAALPVADLQEYEESV